MNTNQEIIRRAKATFQIEIDSLELVKESIGEDFANVAKTVYESEGRLVITGIGKSANIANKIVATLNSTGTPAIFMHAADAIHGDLGNVQRKDVVLCISKSGDTPEIKVLVPIIREMGNTLIGMTAHADSFLGLHSDLNLLTPITQEACPHNLAPTSSTTTQLAMGDALAVCLLEMRDFTSDDFAKYHPGGALGKRLYLRLSDLFPRNEKPLVSSEASLKDIIFEITGKRLGATAVVENGNLLGVITDGDLRRLLQSGRDLSSIKAKDIMGKKPKVLEAETLASDALAMMKENSITQIMVVKDGVYVGVVHLHDILQEGIL